MLHQTDAVVVVDKPAGLLVHNSAWAGPPEETLTDRVRAQFPNAVPVHRLDRQTSGCVVFTTTKEHAQEAQQQHQQAQKQYLALVRGHVHAPLEVDHPLDDDEGGEKKQARSRIECVCRSSVDRCSVVVVTLFTGRKHQARRHCKHVSHPILGDATHGKGPLNRAYRDSYSLPRMALHAWRLSVADVRAAADGVVVEAPLPEDLLPTLRALFPDVSLDEALRPFRG